MRLDHRLVFTVQILKDRGCLFEHDAYMALDAIQELLDQLDWPHVPMPPYDEAQRQWLVHEDDSEPSEHDGADQR